MGSGISASSGRSASSASDRRKSPGRPDGARSLTARWLGYVILAGMILLGMLGGSGLTGTSEIGWAALVAAAMALWAGWLYWRTAAGNRDVPAHLLYPFLCAAILILAGHLLAGGRVDPGSGRIRLLAAHDLSLLTRLMTLALLVLLVQDVLSRVRRLRWLLTGLGGVLAVGALGRLYSAQAVPGAPAVALGGFVGVGILLAPSLLPDVPAEQLFGFVSPRLRRYGAVVRIGLAALLAALLVVAQPQCAQAAALAAAAVAGALLLAGVILTRHRLRLLAIGAVLAVGSAVAIYRTGPPWPQWLGRLTLLGSGTVPWDPSASGLWVLGASAGWAGVAAVVIGLLLTLGRSLYAAREADVGDQARSALWAAVAAMAGCGLFVEGGLTVPAAVVIAAITWGLMPHLMVHRVRRFRGLAVVAAFAAALAVLGLEQFVSGSVWLLLARRYGDGLMHFFGTLVLTAVLCWQVRARRWWQALGCAAAAAAIAALGELGQRYLSTRSADWRDVGWDVLGAGAALGMFLVLYGAMWIERAFAGGPKVSAEKYELWRRFAGPSF